MSSAADGVDRIKVRVPDIGARGDGSVQVEVQGSHSKRFGDGESNACHLSEHPPRIIDVFPNPIPLVVGEGISIFGTGFITSDGDSPEDQNRKRVVLDGVKLTANGDWTSTEAIASLPTDAEKIGTPPWTYGTHQLIVLNDAGRPSAPKPVQLAPPGSGAITVDPPTITVGRLAEIADGIVSVYGSVNPSGQECSYHFEFGPIEGGYVKFTTPTGLPASGIAQPAPGKMTLDSLPYIQQGAPYHYRLVAENAAGISRSRDATFIW